MGTKGDEEKNRQSPDPQQDLATEGNSDLMPVPSLALSNGLPDPVGSTSTPPPDGGFVAWMAGK